MKTKSSAAAAEDDAEPKKIRSSHSKRRRRRHSRSSSSSESPPRKRSKKHSKRIPDKKSKRSKARGGGSRRRRHRSLSHSLSLSLSSSPPSVARRSCSSCSSSSASERSVSPRPKSRSRDVRRKKGRERDRERDRKRRKVRRSASSSSSSASSDRGRRRSRSKSRSRSRKQSTVGGTKDYMDCRSSRSYMNVDEDVDRDEDKLAIAKEVDNDIDRYKNNLELESSPSRNANETEEIVRASGGNSDDQDLELILRHKALENFIKFRAAATMGGKTDNGAAGKEALTDDSLKNAGKKVAEADYFQSQGSNLGARHSAGSPRSQNFGNGASHPWKQENSAGVSCGAGSPGILEPAETGGSTQLKGRTAESTHLPSQILSPLDARNDRSVMQRLALGGGEGSWPSGRAVELPGGLLAEVTHPNTYMQSDHGATVAFNTEDYTITCSCRMFESIGILCQHALRVYNTNGVYNLPSQYILHRWTKYAKRGFYINKQQSEDEDLTTHAALISREATCLALKCTPSKELLDELQKAIRTLDLKADIYLSKMEEKSNEVAQVQDVSDCNNLNGVVSFKVPKVIKGPKTRRCKSVAEKKSGKRKKNSDNKKGEDANVETRDERPDPNQMMGHNNAMHFSTMSAPFMQGVYAAPQCRTLVIFRVLLQCLLRICLEDIQIS